MSSPPNEQIEMEAGVPRRRTSTGNSVRFDNGSASINVAVIHPDGVVGVGGVGANFPARKAAGAFQLARIESDASFPSIPSIGALKPPSGVGVPEVPSEDPIRRRLNSNVVVTKKRIRGAKASPEVTMMHIFRSFVGSGILSMPHAFSHAGVVMAPFGLLLTSAVVVFRSLAYERRTMGQN